MNSILLLSVVLTLFAGQWLIKIWKVAGQENQVDWGNTWLNRMDGIGRYFCHTYHGLTKQYIDLPDNGPAIVVGNHVSGLDPLMLAVLCHRPVRFLIAREEYNRFGFQWLFKAAGCIPVDRVRNPEKALHAALAQLKAGEVIGIFPHGGIRWPVQAGSEIKGGAIRLAQRSQCPIYPVFFRGIKLPGFTLPALLVRSQVKVKLYPPMYCDTLSYQECKQQLAQILNQDIN